MSQKELSRKSNISTSSLSKIERGKYNDNISVSLLMDIAGGLQIDLILLVTFSELKKICGENSFLIEMGELVERSLCKKSSKI